MTGDAAVATGRVPVRPCGVPFRPAPSLAPPPPLPPPPTGAHVSGLVPGARHGAWRPAAARYVALDVDGTLVGPDGGIGDPVVEAIAAAQDAGIHAGVATGRPYGGVQHVIARTGLRGPHITFNGAAVVHRGEVARSWPVAPDVATEAVEQAVERDVRLEVYTADGYLVTDDDPRREVHTRLLDLAPVGLVRPGDALPEVIKLAAITFDDEDPAPVVELLVRLGLKAEATSSPATPGVSYVNATDPAADKGVALLAVADLLGIEGTATVAVGDGLNDIAILRAAGTGVVMGQVDEAEVRDAAHLVAPGIGEHGVAVTLREALDGFGTVARA